MAKAIAPGYCAELRGKVGGLVFNTYRGVPTVKALKAPTQPNTAAQVTARSRLADASRAWAGITVQQRADWETYAASHPETDWTNNVKRLTGHNFYCRCYCRALLVGGSAIAEAPGEAAPAQHALTAVEYDAGGGGVIRAAGAAAPAAGTVQVFYAVGPLSVGRNPKFQGAAIVAQWENGQASPKTLVAAPSSGKWGIWAQTIDISTGLASARTMYEVTVP